MLAGFPAQYVIADTGYDSQTIVEAVERAGDQAVIPSRAGVKHPRDPDFTLYAERYRIECFFNRLKHYRAIATRDAKRARNFTSVIYRAATMLWMK